MIHRLRHFQQHVSGWLALTAVLVLLVGKSVHLGQECGDSCCSVAVGVAEVEVTVESQSCSCGHHASEEESGSESEQHHDQHQCPVCSVLSHVTDCPLIVGLPSESQLATVVYCQVASVAIVGEDSPFLPRGPPAIASRVI